MLPNYSILYVFKEMAFAGAIIIMFGGQVLSKVFKFSFLPSHYKVSHQDINGTSYNMTTTTTYFHVTGLSPNTTYTMTVVADNGNETNRSVSLNVTTHTTGISGNERNMSVSVNVTTNTTGMLSEHCNVYSILSDI